MATNGTVLLSDVWSALNHCLPGWRAEERKHHWCVYPPKGHPYPRLPKGEHGRRADAEIERGHVKHMARVFGILPCMQQRVEGL